MNRIQDITITFPEISDKSHEDNKKLFSLLAETRNLSLAKDTLKSIFEKELLPKTIINTSNKLNYPQVSFNTDYNDKSLEFISNNLKFGFNLSKSDIFTKSQTSSKQIHFISIDELVEKLSSHLIEVNHCGINFSPEFIHKDQYQEFKSLIASKSNFYNYPTGEEWPFIIPADNEEFKNDILDESINRNPKFETVYSEYNRNPVIQFDFKTDLAKEEAYKLFPNPYGVSYDGLEEFFRSVFVKVDWGNVLLRFDLGFGRGDNDFGYWIVKDGGRIKPNINSK